MVGDQRFQTIVVQNGIAIDRLEDQELLQQFSGLDLQIVHDNTPGLLSGRHRGYQESDADILVFLDDDVALSASWLESVRYAFRDPAVSLVGGPSKPEFESSPPDWLIRFWEPAPSGGRMLSQLSLLELDAAEPMVVDPNMIWGLNFSVRRSVLEASGGFHPDCVPPEFQHFQGDGETGLTRKIAAGDGVAVYHPGALVHHWVGNERMTHEYFDRRYFYQGVCDSYTKVRMGVFATPRSSVRSWIWKVRSTISGFKRAFANRMNADDLLAQRFLRAYEQGFDFHQQCVAISPRLVEWVQRESYFEYQYPTLESDFHPPARIVHQ